MTNPESFEKKYYEQEALWGPERFCNSRERERFTSVLEFLPNDFVSIIDVGCGNGAFLNSLREITGDMSFHFSVGFDRSTSAIRQIKGNAVQGSIAHLPFPDQSFDLVLCQEVLEHLPQQDYRLALEELARIAKRYVLITVPNSDDLANSLCMCKHCQCWFNSSRHVRSFDQSSIQDLMDPRYFNLLICEEIGSYIVMPWVPKAILSMYRYMIKPPPPPLAICPQCGFQVTSDPCAESIDTGFLYKIMMSIRTGLVKGAKLALKSLLPQMRKKMWLVALWKRHSE